MLLVESAIGNRRDDPFLDRRCEEAHLQGRLETLQLAPDLAQRRRFRTATSAGTEVGVCLGKGDQLQDGDVLLDEKEDRIIVVVLEQGLLVYFYIDPSAGPASFESGVRLGHLLGMQHWTFSWKDGRCAVPIVDRRTVEDVLRAHPVRGVRYQFSVDEFGQQWP